MSEFFELVKIDGASHYEQGIVAVVKEKLFSVGLKVAEDDVAGKTGGNCGNLIATLPDNGGKGPTLMLSAHLDSVGPCAGIEPQIQQGVIRSNGQTVLGADDKAGVAAILEALRVIQTEKIPHGSIQVVFTVAEECGLLGSKHIDRSQLKADFGDVFDSGGAPGTIVSAAPGQNNVEITIYGKTAHAGVAPEEGINAIQVAGKVLSQLQLGRIDQETTANIGIITGGTATNIVPGQVKMVGEVRSRSSVKLANQTNKMVALIQQVAAENGASAEVKVGKAYEAYFHADGAPVIRLAKSAAAHLQLEPVTMATGGGSDANNFNGFGLPTVVLGVGMNQVHTTAENIRVVDLVDTARLAVALIQQAAREE